MVEENRPTANEQQSRKSPFAAASVLITGVYLGILFIKSEVASWERIHNMFLFKEAHMYLIIGLAICVAMCSMLLIKRLGIKSVDGKPITYDPKPYHTGVIIGGMLFGAGWAITGACPGPIYAQIGAGAWMALFTFVGAMLGMFTYAALKPKLPH
jgi:uncharacterized membrane protein YedE/YeeE